ncbi:hypothetical protein [Deinococcus ruber]|uniref:Lipoprotein n=1 Tax=Deinococcus ruber TaxID=1848197 RepID=A0A918C508_9DEIO|nr:hypothetical protein [Deinococcus ruber]GGR05293.1 hypothetical protein GCM10008957_17790 [Deinococcus ruber]
MKKFLLLIPLLGACAPAVSDTSAVTAVGPFKVGQTWVLTSNSKTESLIPSKTLFTIEQVLVNRNTVIGNNPLASNKTPIQIEYTPEDGQLLVADISPMSFGSKKIRTCFFFEPASQSGVYSGIAAHFDPSQTKIDPEAFKTQYLKNNPKATDKEAIKAFAQSVSENDGGTCMLFPLE